MFGNGVTTGMEITQATPKPTQKGIQRGRSACSAVAAGATLLGIAGWRIASASIRTAATAVLASVWFPPINRVNSILLSKKMRFVEKRVMR